MLARLHALCIYDQQQRGLLRGCETIDKVDQFYLPTKICRVSAKIKQLCRPTKLDDFIANFLYIGQQNFGHVAIVIV